MWWKVSDGEEVGGVMEGKRWGGGCGCGGR